MSSVEMGCTFGGGAFALGAGGVTGFAVGTFGDQCLFVDRVRRGRPAVSLGASVSPAKCSTVSWRALMVWSWAYIVDTCVFLSAVGSCCNPCSTLSSGIT